MSVQRSMVSTQTGQVLLRALRVISGAGSASGSANDVLDVELLGKDCGIDGPGKIGGADAIVDDRTGNTKTSGANFFVTEVTSGNAREFLGNEIELRKILAAKTLPENGRQPAAALRKKREVAFGAADITGQYHRIPQ